MVDAAKAPQSALKKYLVIEIAHREIPIELSIARPGESINEGFPDSDGQEERMPFRGKVFRALGSRGAEAGAGMAWQSLGRWSWPNSRKGNQFAG